MDTTEAAKRGYEAWRMALSGWGDLPEWTDLKEADRFRWHEAAKAILGASSGSGTAKQ